MPLFADLSGVPVVHATLTVPYSGIWHADVTLDRVLPAPLVGPQVLTLSSSVWACAVVESGDFAGSRRVRLVGGTGGWRRPLPLVPAPFSSPVGVPLAVVLNAVSSLAGELPVSLVGYLGSQVLGPAYVFQGGPTGFVPSLVLQDLLGDGWWMDLTGAIQTAPRLPTPIVTPWTAVEFSGSSRTYTIATDFPGQWVPGAVFVGPTVQGTISRVTHTLDHEKLRTHVMGLPA